MQLQAGGAGGAERQDFRAGSGKRAEKLSARDGRSVVSVSGAGASVRCGIPAKKQPVYLGVIHRLDQPVSGLLVFAKNQRAAASLSAQVAKRQLEKIYRAKVYAGADAALPEDGTVLLQDYMIKLPGGGARIAEASEAGAKEARLEYRCLERRENCALVEVSLDTGPHHQIRVQMANAGMPLFGGRQIRQQPEQADVAGNGDPLYPASGGEGFCFYESVFGEKGRI